MSKMPKNIRVDIHTKGGIISVPSQIALERQFEPYAVEMGKLVYAWNRLHEKLAGLFWAVTGISDGAVPFAIWHSIPSDLSQRRMLRASVQAKYPSKSAEAEDLEWLLNKVDSISSQRNNAIHAPLAFMTDAVGTKLEPSWYSGNPRAKQIEGKDLMKEFRWYRESCDVLSVFADQMHYSMRMRKERPWPKKPRMPLLGDHRHNSLP
jgi:hypothetical protein